MAALVFLESWNCGTFGSYEGLALGGGFDSILQVNFARGTMSARINIVSFIIAKYIL